MEEILGLLIPLTFVLCLVIERLAPARPLPRVRFWLLKGFVFFVMTGALNAILPALVAGAVAGRTPIHLASLGTAGGALVALLVGELAAYGIHRVMHRVPWLWRWTHQLHHSAERVDIAGAVIFHPFDIALQIGVTTAAVAVLGVTADAAAIAGFFSFLCAMFQHLNVRTPRWVGWFVQRPEAHAVHHARGVHAYNYGNIALWDQVFGTYRNPATATEPAGFYDGASSRLGAMLLGRDVAEPPAAAAPTGTTSDGDARLAA
jgi:sterol desaturase/sphingolipid hydroxylase (fatty acid hydroxylase superfamily)